MITDYAYIKYTCKECDYEYSDIVYKFGAACCALSEIGAELKNTPIKCLKCGDIAVNVSNIKAATRSKLRFDVLTKKTEPKKEIIPVLLSWICVECGFTWDTQEMFTSQHTRKTRLPFIEADKRCPNCRSNDVSLFSEKDL